jgi:hypothetical protein
MTDNYDEVFRRQVGTQSQTDEYRAAVRRAEGKALEPEREVPFDLAWIWSAKDDKYIRNPNRS